MTFSLRKKIYDFFVAFLALLQLLPSLKKHKHRILIIDSYLPYSIFGAGYPRARQIMLSLLDMGYEVSLYPMVREGMVPDNTEETIPAEVKQIRWLGDKYLKVFLKIKAHEYETILISRPENMKVVQKILDRGIINRTTTRIIYDAEAIFAAREINKQRFLGNILTENEAKSLIAEEISVAKNADATICVTEQEKRIFENHGIPNIFVLGHTLEAAPTLRPFSSRNSVVFVGPTVAALAPNADGMKWFFDQIYPLIAESISNIPITLAGKHVPEALKIPALPNIHVLNAVNNLTEVYNQARIFISPTRYAAGLPIKIQHAAAHGVPVVCTSLLADQLGWKNEEDLLVADSPEAFAAACIRLYQDPVLWEKLRRSALKRIENECNPAITRATLTSIMST